MARGLFGLSTCRRAGLAGTCPRVSERSAGADLLLQVLMDLADLRTLRGDRRRPARACEAAGDEEEEPVCFMHECFVLHPRADELLLQVPALVPSCS